MAFRTLLGRGRELEDLAAALERALAGRGEVFLLSGEAGIGKTRLAEELAALAEQRGASVFWGRAWEASGAPACWPWLQVLRACAATEVVPLLEAPADPRHPEVEALRLGTAIAAFLRGMASRAPLVLVFDDLHAADLASLNLLQVVARELRHVRLLVVGTYRDLEARRAPQVSTSLVKLAREGTLRPLGRLDRAAVAQWIAGALGAAPSDALTSAVFAATEGNPLFVDALAQLLVSRGYGASLPAGFTLPDTVRETVQEMLVRVSSDVRDVLDAASVLGRECSLVLLQSVCEKPIERVLEATEAGLAAGVLSAQPLSSSPVRFAHILVREALYQGLSASRRMALHARASRALSSLHATDLEAHLAELAHHAFEAGPVGSWPEAADYAVRAGRRAMDLLAFDDAAGHFERALVALDHAGGADEVRRAELLWRLGLSRIRMGNAQAGKETCIQAAALAERAGDVNAFAQAALAYGAEFWFGNVDQRLVDLLERALSLGTMREELRVRVMARLAPAMVPSLDRGRSLMFARESVVAARALEDRRVLADVIYSVRAAYGTGDDLDERVGLDRELALLATRLGDKLLEAHAHGRLTLDAIERADPAVVNVELRIHRQITDEIRVPQYRLHARIVQLTWATLQGDGPAIARIEQEVRELSEAGDDPHALAVIEANRAVRAEVRDDQAGEAAAMEALELLSVQNPRLRSWLTTRRAARATALPPAELRVHLAPFTPSKWPVGMGAFLANVVPIFIAQGDRSDLRAVYEAMRPYADRVTIYPGVMTSAGPLAYYLGRVASALGEMEKAYLHFQETLAICQRGGFVDFEAHTRRALARLDRPASPVPVATAPPPPPSLERESEFWVLRHEGREVRLKDAKGLHYLAALLREPGREFHVGDLVQPLQDGPIEQGGSGAWLDERAKFEYRTRLAELGSALEDAEARGDAETAARIRDERETIGGELAHALGLGGRNRKAGDALERARVNVQRRIRDVISRVVHADPTLGRHLELHVRTGTFCCWEP
ncbi:AAA family ATPase [Pendulispora rubella]|uniref:AAA family ATPase n=1 Tax=Pendulispora rubella TaxID=2741070 RepID=A0ABZ2L9S8_9BACT